MSAFSSQINSPKSWDSKVPSGYRQGFLQQFTPEQMNLFQQMFGHLGPDSFLSKMASGDQSAFEEMEAPAWQQFNQAQGQLANRFSGMGTGSQKSSGFRNTMGQLGSDFAQQLASKRYDYRNQAMKDLMGYSNQLLEQRPYDQFITEKQKKKSGFNWGGAASGAGSGAATGAMFGPWGAAIGGIGGGLLGGFSG